MLDPRIYRTGLVAVLLAVIVFAFSLQQQQGSLGATLAPYAFNGLNANADMTNLATHYQHRAAGTGDDNAIANEVAYDLRNKPDNFTVSTQSTTVATPGGSRTIQNVIATRSGLANGTIVVVAPRDSTRSSAVTTESGTGVLLDLGTVLSGETLNHTIVLASTSGSVGSAGITKLIDALPGPVDAVLVLGDMAGTTIHQPVVVPWSDGLQLAPLLLRNTVASALASQANQAVKGPSFGGEFAHLAFPFTVSGQGPFNASGIPAVLLSTSGELAPSGHEQPNQTQITQFGRATLATISALDSAGPIPAPSAYLQIDGNVIPVWAVRLLLLGLILPVLLTTIDGFARARRRGHRVGRWIAWVLAAAVPFVLAGAVIELAKLTGLLDVAPPNPVAAGTVPLHTIGIVMLVLLAVLIVGSLVAIRRWEAIRAQLVARDQASDSPGAGVALLIVMCLVTLAIGAANPFAALLMVPALHLWMWAVATDSQMHPAPRLALLLAGLIPPIVVIAYYMITLGFGPIGLAWTGVLMIAGGHLGALIVVEWAIALGCTVSVFGIAAWSARRVPLQATPVTVRGPATYAGPGSLGGTESALRR